MKATLHLHPALWALLLPVTVDRRVSDIWRSCIMQVNGHSSSDDINDDDELHHKSVQLLKFLNEWSGIGDTVPKRVEALYTALYERGYLEIADVELILLWLNELIQAGYKFPQIISKFTVAVRTYTGDLHKLNDRLLPSFGMFVDRAVTDILFVLDDESDADHKLGDCLKQNFSVTYEALPTQWKTLFHGTASTHPKYARIGYDRQQWSTFYMDKQVHSDYIGVIDSDGMLFSMMHPVHSMFSSDGRIMLKGILGDHNFNDKVALKADSEIDFMWVNRMPMWYRYETFQFVRNHISRIWNTSFDDAFAEFSKSLYSQFNIMSSYASKFEGKHYRVILNTDTNGAISVGSNGGVPTDIRIGCCRSFDIGCVGSDRNNDDHLLTYGTNAVNAVNRTVTTEAYYKNVYAYLKQVRPDALARMKETCDLYLKGQWKPLCTVDSIAKIKQ
ncbi:unnamed protein product [Rotaria sp. Silwood2]|nr:unnamed protein product [Rotaria sp. Silwood2]